MVLAAIENVWQVAVQAGGVAVWIVLAYLSYRTKTAVEKAAKVGDTTHALVNSNMGVQLKLNQTVSRRLADLTRDPEDIKAAELARQMWEEHESRQAAADAQGSD